MWIQLIIILPIACLGIIAFLRFNFTIATVHGSSMYPTLKEGDRLLSLNLLPRFWLRKGQVVIGNIKHLESLSSPELFADIDNISELDLTFENLSEAEMENIPFEPDYSKFIKRIIGLPGDTISIPLSSLHEFMQSVLRSRCDANGNLVWTVPEKHCFVRGDGLISMDSLTVGPIPMSAITGITLLKLPRHSDVDSIHQLKEVCDEA
ncbi:signal peptidase I [Halotia wernerae UHCC 0503]|nr:signal peptidase I [Halotia wernerae UHCC 0503]